MGEPQRTGVAHFPALNLFPSAVTAVQLISRMPGETQTTSIPKPPYYQPKHETRPPANGSPANRKHFPYSAEPGAGNSKRKLTFSLTNRHSLGDQSKHHLCFTNTQLSFTVWEIVLTPCYSQTLRVIQCPIKNRYGLGFAKLPGNPQEPPNSGWRPLQFA